MIKTLPQLQKLDNTPVASEEMVRVTLLPVMKIGILFNPNPTGGWGDGQFDQLAFLDNLIRKNVEKALF